MVVGKTHNVINKTDLLEMYSEIEILCAAFPEIKQIPCRISSPFREDRSPSFSIYMKDGNVRYIDFGDQDTRGGLLDLLCKKWDCSFKQVFDHILDLMQGKNKEGVKIKFKDVRVLTTKEQAEYTQIAVAVRPWKEYDYNYWAAYGITKQWLRYAEIYPISHKIVTKRNAEGESKKYIFPADPFAYVFVERKEGNLQLKIYQPFNLKGYKWCSKMDRSVVGLWTKIPESGDRVVICSSLKDALVLACQCHIPTLCLQGEGYSMSNTAVKELKRRFKRVFVCFDTDEAGRKDAEKLSKDTGFINVVPDLGKEKDLSDYYKSLEDKTTFKQLETLFH